MSSLIIAFAMYSKIPMPKFAWNEKNMKYAICYFPFIGVVIGIMEVILFYWCGLLQCGPLLKGVLLTALPLVVTGGIHMDGYLDTVDARSSYGDREQKLLILKDPHTGAFALMKGILYIILQVGFFSEITWNGILVYSFIYMISRAMSGYALATFKGAKSDGLLATFAKGANKKAVAITMLLYYGGGILLLGGIICMIGNEPFMIVSTLALYLCSALVFWYYHYFSTKEFQGITGDLAGYFVQLLELITLITIVIIEKVWIWILL